jgi:acetyl-CoA carboxylase biotin carboxyl carrier protein
MDIKVIKRIIDLMKANDLCEFEMEEEGFRIAIKRRNGSEPQVVISQPPAAPVLIAPAAAAAAPAVAPAAEKPGEAVFAEIKSPIVGTFYRSSSPDAEPYVTVGQEVEEDTVVCIIEAMKVMNEIKAEVKGTIRKILVENATPVQFGQVLFQVEPR